MRIGLLAALLMSTWACDLRATPIAVDGNGSVVGFYVGVGTQAQEEYAISPTGYRFAFDRETGRLLRPEGIYTDSNGQAFFTTTDCSGQAYITDHPGVKLGLVMPAAYPQIPGGQASGIPLVFYLSQTNRPATQTVLRRSFWAFLGAGTQVLSCFNGLTPDERSGIPLLPNSPSETGVPSGGFVPPLRVISSWLFRDGFEQPLSGTHPALERSSRTG